MKLNMKTPLIIENARNNSIYAHFITFFGLSSLLLIACTLIFQNHRNERALGVGNPNMEWGSLVLTYFGIGSVPKLMRPGMPYRGSFDPELEDEECPPGTPICEYVCEARISPRPETEHLANAKECFHNVMTCWDALEMRCWNPSEQMKLWDAYDHDWDVIYHYQGHLAEDYIEDKPSTPWIHLRSIQKKIDFFVFAWGNIRSTANICAILSRDDSANSFGAHLSSVPREHAVVLAGHSEGAMWAICANKQFDFPNERRVIASGTLLVDSDFLTEYEITTPPGVTLNLLAAQQINENLVIPDLFAFESMNSGSTFPQFGFTCETTPDRDFVCVEPQPSIDIEASLRISETIETPRVMGVIHTLKYYKQCFAACWNYFQQHNIYFAPNVASFTRASRQQPQRMISSGTPSAQREEAAPSGVTALRPPPAQDSHLNKPSKISRETN